MARYRSIFKLFISAVGFAIICIFCLEWVYSEPFDDVAHHHHGGVNAPHPHTGGRRELAAGNVDTAAGQMMVRTYSATPSLTTQVSPVTPSSPSLAPRHNGTTASGATTIARNREFQPLELEDDEMRILKERKSLELRVEASEKALWWYIRARTSELLKDDSLSGKEVKSRIADLLQGAETQHFALSSRIRELERAVEKGLELKFSWKVKLARELSELMQKRLDWLQNPTNCSAAKKLVCDVGKACGFGCQMHHVAYCFITAYATERTLILDSRHWKYSPDEGWEGAFLPASRTCKLKNISKYKTWGKAAMNESTIQLPIIEIMRPPINQLPPAVPSDLTDKLTTFHGFPFVWFMGQFIKYLMKPNAQLQKYIHDKRKMLGVQRPIVGIHVRRTDKLKIEASFHAIEEYMKEVAEWYDSVSASSDRDISPRRVYLATDDPTVYSEAKKKYPKYTFISDQNITKLANKVEKRRSFESLYGIIFDVMMLAESDFLVCTFSSQVCRLAYELMQTNDIDASSRFYSLDDVYYFGGQQQHSAVAIENHTAQRPEELNFLAGDRIGVAGNMKNGYSFGVQMSTEDRQKGVFPSYKVESEVLAVDFPTYPNVI